MDPSKRRAEALALLAASVLFGCSACARARERPPAEVSSSARPTSAELRPRAPEGAIRIAEEIRRSCRLPLARAEEPHYAFDSAALSARAATVLDALGACLSGGPLAYRRIVIVGRTDALGPRRYNEELGLARALGARAELERVGVPAAAIEVRSGGESEASGRGDSARASDRRVDIELLP